MIEEINLESVSRFISYDLEKDKELQEIVELASGVTKAPVALITFLDDDTQYIKVKKGIDVDTVPRPLSFCTHAVEQKSFVMVEDTLADEIFAYHPLVMGEPNVRFFASMPLTAPNGDCVGTICVVDFKPNSLDEHQQLVLKILAAQVMKILELRGGMDMLMQNQRELREQKMLNNDANIRLRSFFESSTNFQVLLGRAGEVIDFNKTAYNFVRAVHKAELKRGDQFVKYIHPGFVATFLNQYNLALTGQRSQKEGSTDYEEMGVIWWEAAFEAARNNDNEIIGISYIIRNVTERKLKEQKIISQNQSLLKIAHIQAHEFRAPLTTIMGLMSLIKEDNYNPPSEYIQFLELAVETLDTTIRKIVSDIDDTVVSDFVTTYH